MRSRVFNANVSEEKKNDSESRSSLVRFSYNGFTDENIRERSAAVHFNIYIYVDRILALRNIRLDCATIYRRAPIVPLKMVRL